MVLPPEGSNRPVCPRLSPQALRSAGPYFGAAGSNAADMPCAEAGPRTRVVRKSFWECEAEYNPLGQFGASWSSHP
jgi:hypothetical protein